jgi:hypothetical protein
MSIAFRSLLLLFALTGAVQLRAQERAGSKQIALETEGTNGATVYIDNVDRKITIKPAINNTIRLVTTVFYEGKNALSDVEWFNNLNLELRGSGSDIVIQPKKITSVTGSAGKKIDPVNRGDGYDARNATGTGIAVFDSAGQWGNRKANINRDLELFLPPGVNVNISSRYADVVVETSLDELRATINHASLQLYDCKKTTVRGNYAFVKARHIDNSSIEINNGELMIKEMLKADITSKNSSVSIMTSNDITIHSTDDQYDLDVINNLHGTKDFGDLRIVRIKGSIELVGNNADIKIRNILPSVSLIRIDNKYAAMELPVAGLTNYTVAFEGKFTKVLASFAKQDTPNQSTPAVDGPPADASFKAAIGDNKGAHTEFKLSCSTCTVDFK